MWTVVKINKNCNIKDLEINLNNLFADKPIIYSPKILQQIIKGNKFYNKNHYILGSYLLIFHKNLCNKFLFKKLNFIKGINIVLKGFEYSQNEIKYFVEKCKKNENKKGYLVQDFFVNGFNNKIKFSSGPFVNFVISLLEVKRNKISVLAGKYKILVNKKITI